MAMMKRAMMVPVFIINALKIGTKAQTITLKASDTVIKLVMKLLSR